MEHVLAHVISVGAAGIKLQLDGEPEPRQKLYKGNADLKLRAGDRVLLENISGTYLIAYRVGIPGSR